MISVLPEDQDVQGELEKKGSSDLYVRLQHQSRKWSSDYSVNVGDAMFGARFLRHFEPSASSSSTAAGASGLNAAEVESEESSGPGCECRFLLLYD